jgi:hypothetical protein
MFRVETTIIKAEIKISQERMEAKIEATRHEFQSKAVKAGVERRRGTGTGVGAAKLPKFHGTTS